MPAIGTESLVQISRLEKRHDTLKECLADADRRFALAIGKIVQITARIHEMEVERNASPRDQFLNNKIGQHNREDETYQKVMIGYKSMSRRKNELEEERNQYVKELEELEKTMQRKPETLT